MFLIVNLEIYIRRRTRSEEYPESPAMPIIYIDRRSISKRKNRTLQISNNSYIQVFTLIFCCNINVPPKTNSF